jgi:hypothetical protein
MLKVQVGALAPIGAGRSDNLRAAILASWGHKTFVIARINKWAHEN